MAAYDAGIRSILILERDKELGGILNQCIHNGFGLHTFKEELTGPEYAARYIAKVKEREIDTLLNTMVMEIGDDKLITAMNREDGIIEIQAKAIVLAMGCRERSRGALNIPGYRPAGIYSAGTAQRLVNMEGYMPGREIVILGSGDIGLIMARRMTLEGAKVKVVAELLPYSGGLKRNIVQCLDDFGIPLKLSHTVVDIQGKERVAGVTIAQVDERGKPIPGTEEHYDCDTLLLSCGLIPENELSRGMGAQVAAGCAAASYVQAGCESGVQHAVPVTYEGGPRYTVPGAIDPAHVEEAIKVRFRVGCVMKDKFINVYLDGERVVHRKRPIMAPGEMEEVKLTRAMFDAHPGLTSICIKVEEA